MKERRTEGGREGREGSEGKVMGRRSEGKNREKEGGIKEGLKR